MTKNHKTSGTAKSRSWNIFLRYAVYYATLYAPAGLILPFLGAFFQNRGISPASIGMLLMVTSIASVIASQLAGYVVHVFGRARLALIILHTMTIISYIALGSAHEFVTVTACFSSSSFFLTGAISIANGLSINATRGAGFGFAAVRSSGSISALLVTLISGMIITHFTIDAFPYVLAAVTMPQLLSVLFLPDGEFTESARDSAPVSVLLTTPSAIMTIVANSLLWASHAGIVLYASMIWLRAGVSFETVGWLNAVSIFSEIIGMMVSVSLLIRFPRPTLIFLICCGIAVIRWLFTGFSPFDLWGVAALQMLHGVTYAIGRIAGFEILAGRLPRRYDVLAHGVQAGSSSFFYSLGALIAGSLFEQGAAVLFSAMAGIAITSASIALLSDRKSETSPSRCSMSALTE